MLLAEFDWEILVNPLAIPVVAIIAVFGYLAIASIAEGIASVFRNRADTELKMELIGRGLSADEIVRIVEAGRATEPPDEDEPVATKPAPSV